VHGEYESWLVFETFRRPSISYCASNEYPSLRSLGLVPTLMLMSRSVGTEPGGAAMQYIGSKLRFERGEKEVPTVDLDTWRGPSSNPGVCVCEK
jgi:hypothetical protein